MNTFESEVIAVKKTTIHIIAAWNASFITIPEVEKTIKEIETKTNNTTVLILNFVLNSNLSSFKKTASIGLKVFFINILMLGLANLYVWCFD